METIAFYSYKGGTGRTLLLANAARYFALLGKRVVALDFDFEAPGLHYKLGAAETRGGETAKRGVVDYLLTAVEKGRTPSAPLDAYMLRVPVPPAATGRLWMMPAGSAPSGAYWKALTSLFRQDLLLAPDGLVLPAVLDLKARIEDEYRADLLLIDARTGITELGGIVTSVLADKVVCLFLNNRENLAGARAVMRSLGKAPRLASNEPIEVFAALSRVKAGGRDLRDEVLAFLNEDGPADDETLTLDKLFLLHTDPELEVGEKLHLGGDASSRNTALHKDYVFLLSALSEADPDVRTRAWQRREAVERLSDWLTESYGDSYGDYPKTFDANQIDEGVRIGEGRTRWERYADLVVFNGDDRAEALLVAEYVEGDLAASEVWQWWEQNTRLRCVILFGAFDRNREETRRVFTRGRNAAAFIERDWPSAWRIHWPLSFSGLDDPGDSSVASMLQAVQRGAGEFIPVLVQEWQRAVMFTLDGGAPFRPDTAKQIVDGLAEVRGLEAEDRVLWRTSPDDFGHRRRRHLEEGGGMDLQVARDLHAPLWWRLSARAKVATWGHHHHPIRGGGSHPSPVEFLAQELLGLSLDQDKALRDRAARLVGPGEQGAEAAHEIAPLARRQQLHLVLSDEIPTELRRRILLDGLAHGERSPIGKWKVDELYADDELLNDDVLDRLCRSGDGQPTVVTTNLLGRYESATAAVIVYPKTVAWCARALEVDVHPLENVVLLHETIHAVCHLGRDLDGRMWEAFALPTSDDPSFQPDLLHEGLAQFFTFKMIEWLADNNMMNAFEALTDVQPRAYKRWRKMRDFPVERVREVLVAARTGLGDSLDSPI